jgi:uroporphyrinogen-III synthase
MKKSKITFKEAYFYKIKSADLSDLTHVNYDIIAFFSPADIRSLYENFPDFKQNQTLIAGFGATTIKAMLDAGLVVNVQAPTPQTPSMITAVDKHIDAHNKAL